MCLPEGFHYFLNHIKQRLVVVLDHNIRNGLDPCQTDILLLRALYDLYDDGSIDTFSDTEVSIEVKQLPLYGISDSLFPEAQSLPLEESKTEKDEV